MVRNILFSLTYLCLACLWAFPCPGFAADQAAFTQWLGKIQAYDVLEQELAAQPEQTPETILRRAQASLELRRPKQALQILNSQSAFTNSKLESDRLLLVAKSQRFLGKLPESVLSMSSAFQLMDGPTQQAYLHKYPETLSLWQDVWRVWYWDFVDSPLGSENATALSDKLDTSLSMGSALWPGNSFWDSALPAFSGFKASRSSGWMPQVQFSLPTQQVNAQQRILIAKGLCALGINMPSLIDPLLKEISPAPISNFWKAVFQTVQTGQSNVPASLEEFPIANVFAGNFDHMGILADSGQWRVARPGVPGWESFSETLKSLPFAQARKKIQQELESSLIAPETAQALRLFAFAFAVLENDEPGYRAIWKDLKEHPLPLAFSTAAIVLFELPPETMPVSSKTDTQKLLRRLAGAAGLDALGGFAPFWLECSAQSGLSLASAVQTFPLDPELNLALLKKQWTAHKTPVLAKRAGFLFPNTSLGTEALLYLAQLAGKSGSLHTTAFYLNRLDSRKLSGPIRGDYLQAKAALEIELGRNQDALQSYMELVELDGKRLAPVKRLKLALLAQQQGKMQWAEEVLTELWNDRESLEKPVQAEVLFWLAEGAGAMGRMDEALEKYLRVAWQYREENIWAVTSMYRAAVLYERSRNFETAKILLNAVIRNADRKSQKEAAQDRLKAVDAELNKRLNNIPESERTDFAFPF